MDYKVIIEKFAERHFIKTFSKKYKNAWDITLGGLITEFQYFDLLFLKKIAETIVDSKEIKICKTEFKVAGTQESRHSSGNRCIVAIHKQAKEVHVLLVYHKKDLGGGNETENWKRLLVQNYLEYKDIL